MATTKMIVENKNVCGNCGQYKPNHHISECEFSHKRENCHGDHQVYTRSCKVWRQEKEILTIKHKNNIPLHEAWKMVAGSKTATYSKRTNMNKLLKH